MRIVALSALHALQVRASENPYHKMDKQCNLDLSRDRRRDNVLKLHLQMSQCCFEEFGHEFLFRNPGRTLRLLCSQHHNSDTSSPFPRTPITIDCLRAFLSDSSRWPPFVWSRARLSHGGRCALGTYHVVSWSPGVPEYLSAISCRRFTISLLAISCIISSICQSIPVM